MSEPGTFAAIKTVGRGHARGCSRCGALKNAGTVTTALQAVDNRGTNLGEAGSRIRSKTVSLCEPCAVATYLAIEALLLKESGRES